MRPRPPWAGPLLLALLSAALPACASRLTRPDSFPAAAVRMGVPPYRQAPERCGPYALASVLTFLGKPVSAADLEKPLYSPGASGTLTMDMFLEAKRRGVPARQGAGDLAGLKRELAAGSPSILLLRYPALAGGAGHYVVAEGYSTAPGGIFLLWGDGGESWIPDMDLLGMWVRSGYWRLSFVPGGEQR